MADSDDEAAVRAEALVAAYNEAESDRVGYLYAHPHIHADDPSLIAAVDDLLAALRDAGRLLPDGGQTRRQDGWTHPKDGVVPWCSWAEGMSSTPTHRRTVTEWSDGSVLTGPWEVAP